MAPDAGELEARPPGPAAQRPAGLWQAPMLATMAESGGTSTPRTSSRTSRWRRCHRRSRRRPVTAARLLAQGTAHRYGRSAQDTMRGHVQVRVCCASLPRIRHPFLCGFDHDPFPCTHPKHGCPACCRGGAPTSGAPADAAGAGGTDAGHGGRGGAHDARSGARRRARRPRPPRRGRNAARRRVACRCRPDAPPASCTSMTDLHQQLRMHSSPWHEAIEASAGMIS